MMWRSWAGCELGADGRERRHGGRDAAAALVAVTLRTGELDEDVTLPRRHAGRRSPSLASRPPLPPPPDASCGARGRNRPSRPEREARPRSSRSALRRRRSDQSRVFPRSGPRHMGGSLRSHRVRVHRKNHKGFSKRAQGSRKNSTRVGRGAPGKRETAASLASMRNALDRLATRFPGGSHGNRNLTALLGALLLAGTVSSWPRSCSACSRRSRCTSSSASP